MKKRLFLFILSILSINSYSQINFEKGYFINKENQKISCLIKNLDWQKNPDEIQYKLDELDEIHKTTLSEIKEFEIYNASKYQRHTVNIDRSSESLNELDTNRNPSFKEETLLLKVLVEGKATLYEYTSNNLIRFFFKIDTETISQLVFKSYKISDVEIGVNNLFQQQLLNSLKCENLNEKSIEYLKYQQNSLIKLFVKYNQCSQSDFKNYDEKQERNSFNLTVRPGLKNSSFSFENNLVKTYNTDFGSKLGFRLGIEAEYIFPFNKNKLAIVFEPTYQSYESEKNQVYTTTKIDYSSIEFPVGFRYYFYLNNNSKLFTNGQYVIEKILNSVISYQNNGTGASGELQLKSAGSFALGAGYKYKNKYSAELRVGFPKNILNDYIYYSSNYNTISFILGYTIF